MGASKPVYNSMANLGALAGYPHAARVLRHWLSGSDRYIQIPKSLILSVQEGRDAYDELKEKIKDNIWCSEANN